MLGSNCYIALTELRRTQPRGFVISEVCGATLQANIRADGEETDVWTFAVKLSQTLCQGNSEGGGQEGGEKKNIPNFASNYLPTSVLQ